MAACSTAWRRNSGSRRAVSGVSGRSRSSGVARSGRTELNSGAVTAHRVAQAADHQIAFGLGIDTDQLAEQDPERRVRRGRLIALACDTETRQLRGPAASTPRPGESFRFRGPR